MAEYIVKHPSCEIAGKSYTKGDPIHLEKLTPRLKDLVATKEEFYGSKAIDNLQAAAEVDYEKIESDAVKAIRELHEELVGKKAAGRAGIDSMKDAIIEAVLGKE